MESGKQYVFEQTTSSKLLSNITGVPIPPSKAIVGANAFAHESGIHQHGVLANALTYEIMRPSDVGIPQNTMVLGKHSGFPFYTIGQRKGLGIALGHPAYVLKINAAKNTVMLGSEEQLLTQDMLVETPQWVDAVPGELKVRVRYRSRAVPCGAPRQVSDGRWLVRLHEPVSAITPGQSAVFYCGNMVVGGAFIADQRGINQWINE